MCAPSSPPRIFLPIVLRCGVTSPVPRPSWRSRPGPAPRWASEAREIRPIRPAMAAGGQRRDATRRPSDAHAMQCPVWHGLGCVQRLDGRASPPHVSTPSRHPSSPLRSATSPHPYCKGLVGRGGGGVIVFGALHVFEFAYLIRGRGSLLCSSLTSIQGLKVKLNAHFLPFFFKGTRLCASQTTTRNHQT